MCDKAVSEQGVRLYIRPHTLREWRRDFAQYLRDLGVEANATERAVRGETRSTKRNGIYRAMLRDASTHMRKRAEAVANDLTSGRVKPEPGKYTLLRTRSQVVEGWRALADVLERDGNSLLAVGVRRFTETMPQPLTERETVARQLSRHLRTNRVREQEPTR